MILQKASFYALRIVIHMTEKMTAQNNGYSFSYSDATFLSYNLAKECKIPQHYLYKVLAKLVHTGILKAHPGKKGGYSFTRNPEDITVYDIIEPFENFAKYSECFCGQDYCALYGKNNSQICPLHPILKQSVIDTFARLKSITITDLIKTKQSKKLASQ